MRAWLPLVTAFVVCASTYAQDVPVILPTVRVDVNAGLDGANETSAVASDHSLNRLTVLAAWNRPVGLNLPSDNRIGFAFSYDGGQLWQPDTLLLPPAGFGPPDYRQFDPMTAVDRRTGNLWIGGITTKGTPFVPNGVYVVRFDPINGLQPSVMAHDDDMSLSDKPWMVAGRRHDDPDTTRLYVTFNKGIIWSDDFGVTWTNPISLGPGTAFLPRVGPDGELYVVFMTVAPPPQELNVTIMQSVDSGENFCSFPIATRNRRFGNEDSPFVPGTFRVPGFTYLAVDPRPEPEGGTLYVVYHDISNPNTGNDNVDIFFTKAIDPGNLNSWTTPVVINGDSVNPPGDQFFPWIEVDGWGNIHILFFDTRNNPGNDSDAVALIDTYYMFSIDGGANWNEFRLTPEPWDSSLDGYDPLDFIGDYLGMAVAGNRVYPMYPIDPDPNLPPGDPDIYTRVICHCPGDCGDCDEVVGILDFLALLGEWGMVGSPCDVGLGDPGVGINEFLDLLGHWGACDTPPGSAMAAAPLTLEEELGDACLTQDEWDEYVDVMTDEASSQTDKDRYDCWMRHYIIDCNKCTCPHTGSSGCPNPDPFR